MNRKSTERIELVETQNLALSFRRLRDISGEYQSGALKRAIYHALGMSYSLTEHQRGRIREALELP